MTISERSGAVSSTDESRMIVEACSERRFSRVIRSSEVYHSFGTEEDSKYCSERSLNRT